jgi:hypothetical protein
MLQIWSWSIRSSSTDIVARFVLTFHLRACLPGICARSSLHRNRQGCPGAAPSSEVSTPLQSIELSSGLSGQNSSPSQTLLDRCGLPAKPARCGSSGGHSHSRCRLGSTAPKIATSRQVDSPCALDPSNHSVALWDSGCASATCQPPSSVTKQCRDRSPGPA